MKAVAIRTGQDRQKGPEKFHDVVTVECDKCAAQYVNADNVRGIRYGIFFGINIIETGKWNGILDPRRPNRLSVGPRHTGINNQVFQLNPPLGYDSSEKPPLFRLKAEVRRRISARLSTAPNYTQGFDRWLYARRGALLRCE